MRVCLEGYEPPEPSHLVKQGAACPASSTVSHRHVIITTSVFSPAHAGAFCFKLPGEDSLNYSTGRTRQLARHPAQFSFTQKSSSE